MTRKKDTPPSGSAGREKSTATKPAAKRTPKRCAPSKAAGKPTAKAPASSKAAGEVVPVTIKNHKDTRGGHPHVIVENIEDKHVSVGLSTKPKKGNNAPNYKLEISPLGDGKLSYVRRPGIVDAQKNYEKPRKGKLTPKDYSRVKEYADKAKKKYLEKTKKSSEPPNTP